MIRSYDTQLDIKVRYYDRPSSPEAGDADYRTFLDDWYDKHPVFFWFSRK